MQKNKFIHKDIKAVCSSAAKKLVALGLVTATSVGGVNFASNSYKNIASAQGGAGGNGNQQAVSNATWGYNYIRVIFKYLNRRPDTMLRELTTVDLQASLRALVDPRASSALVGLVRELMVPHYQRVLTNQRFDATFFKTLTEVNRLAHADGLNSFWEEDGNPAELLFAQARCIQNHFFDTPPSASLDFTDTLSTVNMVRTQIADNYIALAEQISTNGNIVDEAILNEIIRLHSGNLNALAMFIAARELENRAPRDAVSNPTQMIQARGKPENGGRQTITGNTMLQVRGTNHIEAWSDTHIHSLSDNELLHEGNGAVNVDRGDIIISDFSNGQETRDVTLNEANSLTVAPGITMRIHNGTEFRIGATAQETLENLQRAMGLTTDNEQQPTSSNPFVRFFSGLMSIFTYILFGRWLGGSGGSK